MRALDFFCGAGGLTRGLLDAGIEVIAGFDLDSTCKKTYEKNNRPSRFVEKDITELTATSVRKALGSRQTTDLLIAGCAPCQPFSQHKGWSKEARQVATDPDATLLGSLAKLIGEILPGQVLIENVPGITRVSGFSTYRRFLWSLRNHSYQIAEGVLDAKHYGVPQSRRRYVLIAMRGRKASLPILESESQPGVSTVRDAIGHYPPIAAGEQHPLVANHVASSLSDANLKRVHVTPHDGGDRRAWPKYLELDCHRDGHDGHTDVYGRMAWDKPAPTLTGKCNSLSNGRYAHPDQDRAMSLREAASLQTFPDSYVFYGYNKHVASHIGNAVPVRFAEVLGRHLIQLRAENVRHC